MCELLELLVLAKFPLQSHGRSEDGSKSHALDLSPASPLLAEAPLDGGVGKDGGVGVEGSGKALGEEKGRRGPRPAEPECESRCGRQRANEGISGTRGCGACML